MTTGIEVVGIVLAVIPLLISAAEHHRIGVAPIDGLVFHAKERNRFANSLDNQRVLFRYCCERLLSIAEIEYAGDLLADGAVDKWKDPDLRRRLGEALGTTFVNFERLVEQIAGIVTRLKHILDSPRILFALSSLSRDGHVRDLEAKIKTLERLLDGEGHSRGLKIHKEPNLLIIQASSRGSKVQKESDVLRIQASRRERASIHKSITTSWGCVCKDTHLVNLSLFPRENGAGLSLLFLSSPDGLDYPNPQRSLPWAWKLVTVKSMQAASIITREISRISSRDTLRPSNTGRTASPCRQLCDVLCKASPHTSSIKNLANSSSLSLGLLKSDDGFEHHLSLDEKLEAEPDLITLQGALRLSSALPNVGSTSWFSIRDRIELAAVLVGAVLQHHALPWLPDTWTSQDVYFLLGPEGLNRATFKKPYFRAPASRALSNREQPPHYPLLYNITLFNLAIVLIEIAYKAPLEDLLNEDEKRDYGNPGGRKYAIPTAAARLVSGIQDQIVFSSYHEVASRCLHGDFGEMKFQEKDLSNDNFLSTVYKYAVTPLEKDVQKLRKG